jgi:hypothetical protein
MSSLGSISGTIRIDYDGTGATKASRDIDNLGKKSKGTKVSLKDIGTGAGLGAAAIAGGFALAIKSAADFEHRLSGIKAVSGATTGEMDKVRAKALQLGKDTVFSASESAVAMEELVKAGVSIPDVLNGAADATVALASAGGIELPKAAEIAANAMNQFGKKAEDMPKIADLIAGAANASAIGVEDFGHSLAQVGAVAHLTGLEFQDTAVAIALMGKAGIKGSDAGTSLKTFLSNLIPTTAKQVSLFNELGLAQFNGARASQVLRDRGIKPLSKNYGDLTKQLIDLSAKQSHSAVGSTKQQKAFEKLVNGTGIMANQFFDAKGKVKSLADVSQVLQTSLKGMSQEQKLATLNTLFGSDAIRASAVLAEAGAKGFNKLGTEMGKISAADVAKTRLDNLKGSIEQMKGSLETAAIGIGAVLLPKVRSAVDGINGLVGAFLKLDAGTQKTILNVGLGVGAFLALVAGIAGVIRAGQLIAGTFQTVNSGLRLTAGAQALWNSSMISSLRLQLMYAAGWVRSTAAMVANRVATLASAAATRVAAVAQTVWAAATNALSLANLRAVASTIATGVAMLASRVAMIAGAVATGVMTAAQWLLNVALTANPIGLVVVAIAALVGAFIYAYTHSARFRAIVQAVFTFIKGFVITALNQVKTVVMAVWNFAVGVFQSHLAVIRAVVSAVFNFVRSFISGQINVVRSVISGVVGFISGRFQALRAVIGIISGIFNSVVSTIRGKISAAVSAAAAIVTGIIGRINSVRNSLVSAGRDLIQGLLNGISAMAGSVIQKARDIANSVKNAIKGALHIGSPSKVMIGYGKNIGEGLVIGMKALERTVGTTSVGLALSAASGPSVGLSGGSAGVGGSSSTTITHGAGVVFERGAVQVDAPQNMNGAQVGTMTARAIATTLSTRTTAPRIGG